jgi:UPF0176 protein
MAYKSDSVKPLEVLSPSRLKMQAPDAPTPWKVIAFYRFQQVPADRLAALRAELKQHCMSWGMKGTILLSTEGINSTVSGPESSIEGFQSWMSTHPVWAGLEFKVSWSKKVPFSRMLVKLKKELIPAGDPTIQPEKATAPRMPAQQLKQWLDEGRDFLLVDTRNRYEMDHGTFQGALDLKLDHFREIGEKFEALPAESKNRPLVLFCTGGIRCEKASVVAQQKGFQEVYQLEGGILKYFEECGGTHYQGNCFVFDYRVAVDPALRPIDLESVDLQSVNFSPK